MTFPCSTSLPARFTPYANYSRAFGKNLEPDYESDNLLVVAVNTTRPRRHKDGELSARTDRLGSASACSAPTQRSCELLSSTSPCWPFAKATKTTCSMGIGEAVPAWAAAGGDIIMGGHIHLPYVRSLHTTFPSLKRDIWTVQAGTSVSSRIREGIANSVNLIRCDGARVAAAMHRRALGLRGDAREIRAPHESRAQFRRRQCCLMQHV